MRNPLSRSRPDLADARPADDRFIPIDPDDLIERLPRDMGADFDAGGFARVADTLRHVLHQESHHFERALLRAYSRLDPDFECRRPNDPDPSVDNPGTELTSADAATRDTFLQRFQHLLDKANYEKLSSAQIDIAVKTANSYGLRVKLNPDLIEHLEIWVRGRTTIDGVRRTPRHPIRGVALKLDAFSRLAVVAQLKGERNVTLKLFRQIPVADVEALLPHAQVTMNWFDRAKVFGGGAGTLGATVVKVFNIGLGLAAMSKLIWIVGIGLIVITVRGILGYRTTRMRRDSQRTTNLYYQNLANNAAVLHRLCDAVESEELKEAVLAYAFCSGPDAQRIKSPRALADAVERYLADRLGCTVNFDIDDAIETMTRLDLWENQNTLTPRDPESATNLLDEHWRERRSLQYHESNASK